MFFSSFALSNEGWCIVSTNFLVTKTCWPGSNYCSVTEEFDWYEASRIVWTHWTKNNKCLRFVNPRQTMTVIHAHTCWSQVKTVHRSFRNPIFLNFNKFFSALNHLMDVEIGNAKLIVTCIHSAAVLVKSIHHDSVVNSLVSLCTLKTLN